MVLYATIGDIIFYTSMKKILFLVIGLFSIGAIVWFITPPEPEFDGERYVTLSGVSQDECLTGEAYDTQTEACYIECSEIEECYAKEDELFAQNYGEFRIPERLRFWESPPTDEEYLVRYTISGDDLTNPQLGTASGDESLLDENTHQDLWDQVDLIIPDRYVEQYLSEFVIFSDGLDETLAYVEPLDESFGVWALGVDPADSVNTQLFTATIVHELAHLLSLNSEQINPESDSCHPTYVIMETCVIPSSYVAGLFDRFWVDIHEEWDEIAQIQDEDTYYSALDEFYLARQDDFVSDYAVTNPEEDFAESFMVFVLDGSANLSGQAKEKVEFFAEFPEFVELRSEIRNAIISR